MKKIIFTITTSTLLFPILANAQWLGNAPGPIHYNGSAVGIGTANPASPLEVQTTDFGWLMNLRTNAVNPGNINGLKFFSGYLGDQNKWSGISSVAESLHSNSTGLALYSNTTERLRIAANGNVGIGTATPSKKFTVSAWGDEQSVTPLLRLEQYNTGEPVAGTGVSIDMAIGDNYNLPNLAGQIRLVRSDYINTTMYFSTALSNNVIDRMMIDPYGNVGIGTNNTGGHKLAVNGNIIATSITVKNFSDWPDYVFSNKYKLPPLSVVKAFVNANHHLPDVPSSGKVTEQGIDLGEMNKILLQKVEELTLYLIQQNEQLQEQQQLLNSQKSITQNQQEQIDEMKKEITLLFKSKNK